MAFFVCYSQNKKCSADIGCHLAQCFHEWAMFDKSHLWSILGVTTFFEIKRTYLNNTGLIPNSLGKQVRYGDGEVFLSSDMVSQIRERGIIRPYLTSNRRYCSGFVLRADKRDKDTIFSHGFLIGDDYKFHDCSAEEVLRMESRSPQARIEPKASGQIEVAMGVSPYTEYTWSYGVSTTTFAWIAEVYASVDGKVYLIDAREYLGVIIDKVIAQDGPSLLQFFTGRDNAPFREVNFIHSIPESNIVGVQVSGNRFELNPNYHPCDVEKGVIPADLGRLVTIESEV